MLKKLILRNAKRQLGDYVLYCITIACAVACMYAYNALLFSDKVRQLPELEVLPYMIIAVTLLIILVMGWLVSYMTGYMLKRRSRELSLYMVSGLSARTIAGLFLYENLIIAGTAFIAGLPAGILLSWLVESAVLKMFGMTFTLGFSVSFKTAGLTLFTSENLFTDNANSMVADANLMLFTNTVASMSDSKESVSVPVKSYEASMITINDGTAFTLGALFMLLLPLGLLIAGILVWMERRKR